MPFTRKCGGFFRFSAWEFTPTCVKWKNLNEAKPRKGIAFARTTPWVHRPRGGIPKDFFHLPFDTSFGLLRVRGKAKNYSIHAFCSWKATIEGLQQVVEESEEVSLVWCYRPFDRLRDRSIDRLRDRSIDRLRDRSIHKLRERSIHKLRDRSIHKLWERSIHTLYLQNHGAAQSTGSIYKLGTLEQ